MTQSRTSSATLEENKSRNSAEMWTVDARQFCDDLLLGKISSVRPIHHLLTVDFLAVREYKQHKALRINRLRSRHLNLIQHLLQSTYVMFIPCKCGHCTALEDGKREMTMLEHNARRWVLLKQLTNVEESKTRG